MKTEKENWTKKKTNKQRETGQSTLKETEQKPGTKLNRKQTDRKRIRKL